MANELEMKICKICGRIIIDPNNIIGLCPSCQKKGLEIVIPTGGTLLTAAAAKWGKPTLQVLTKQGKRGLDIIVKMAKK